MVDISKYTGLITSEHADKPKFMATIAALSQGVVDQMNAIADFPADFDLDDAVGVQLDAVGAWVGISRRVSVPLTGVYFSFDIIGVGWDSGVWQGPFDPDSGISDLDDETYRLLIRGKIAANQWDGTLPGLKSILESAFGADTKIVVVDNQDMSMDIGVAGNIPSLLFLALLFNGYLHIKPAAVRINSYQVVTVGGAALFGFDAETDYISGFDVGAWGTTDIYAVT
ncbi:DUF2612 domain-containing protein [Robbsia andropogonis]|uniref:DUF2612 domain-containing protein n=1 Tax=Robbsia andropogonis TaxID=28092 RepID=UPI003D248A9D